MSSRNPNDIKDGFTITFTNGSIKFTNEEGVLYARLFHIVDTDSDGYIGGAEGAAFIRRARLINEANREIWRLASGGKSQEKLNKDCWFVAMKLVALVQTTNKCQMQALYLGESLPLADFHIDSSPDNKLLEYTMEKNENAMDTSRKLFQVSVSTPVVIGSGYTRYTQYIITTKCSANYFPVAKAEVKRRFSDFEWLYQRLLLQFRGTIIPPLPEKRWTGNMDATFVEERRQALEHFINEVCNHEKLSQTLELQIALTASLEGLLAGKELLPVSSIAATYVPSTASVSSLWSSLKDGMFLSNGGSSIEMQQIDIKTDEDYAKIGESLNEYEKCIREVKRTTDIVYAAQRSDGYELSRFGSFLSALSAHESQNTEIHQIAEKVGDQFERVSNLYQDELDNILATYVSVIRYQAGKVASVKTVLNNREDAISEVHRASKSMMRHKERFAAARAISGAAASAMRAEQKMASAEDRMNNAKEQVDFIANSLKAESKRMKTNKAEDLKNALIALASSELEYHSSSRRAWENLIPILQVPDSMIEESRAKVQQTVSYRKPGEQQKHIGQIIGLL